ncbi:MAG: YDG domain-containing protein, partial [Candidatus Omnitrophota bacterium]|nr:YDG domain-containing protein [Candidatus Omnitrophota bacterium]
MLKATRTTVYNDQNPSYFYGNITFYNFECLTPDKELYFEAGRTYTFKGSLNIVGSPDIGAEEYYIKLRSQTPGSQYYINIDTDTYTLDKVFVSDFYALNYIFIPNGVNEGNNYNMLIDPTWDGGGTTYLWSDANNWSGNTLPNGDAVTFDGTSTKDSIVDAAFTNSILSLTITAAYTGTISLANNLTITGSGTCFSQAGGTFNETNDTAGANGNNIVHANGSLSVTGGTFNGPSNPNGATTAATRITTATELNNIPTTGLGLNYVQTVNITDWTGVTFSPINTFTGKYNGYGYTIDGLTINLSATDNVGLFGSATATLSNIYLTNVNITGQNNVGALVGLINSGNSTISNCYSTGTVTGTGSYVGGLVGYINLGTESTTTVTISGSYSTANVSGVSYVGGLIGLSSADETDQTISVSSSYATGTILGTGDYVGGLVGQNYAGGGASTFADSYATGNVSSTALSIYVGGLVGSNDIDPNFGYGTNTIDSCYALGTVSANGGGLAGGGDTSYFTNSYFTDYNHDNSYGTLASGADTVWTWTGAGDGTTWASAANWSNPRFAGYPSNYGHTAVFDAGSSSVATPSASTLTLGNLTLATGYSGTLTLGNNLTIDGTTDAQSTHGTLAVNAGTFVSGAYTVTIQGASGVTPYDATAANTDWTNGTLNIQADTDFTLPASEAYNNLTLGRYSEGGTTTYAMGAGTTISGTWTIDADAKISLTVSAAGVNKVYDGGTTATVTTSDDGVAGKNHDFTINYTATFDTKNVGTDKTVSVSSISLSGTDAGYYTLLFTTATTTANITAKPITVTATAGQTKVYGASDPTFTYTNTALVGGDSFSGALGRNAGTDVGTYAITQGTLSAGSNYTITFESSNFSITAKDLTVTGITANNKTYDGTTAATLNTTLAALSGVVAGDTVTLDTTAATGAFASKD